MASMALKKKLLWKSRLYIIADKQALGKRKLTALKKIKKLPIILQYRDKVSDKDSILKGAKDFLLAFGRDNFLFIVNDYPDIAKIINADGVHLGQSDASVSAARKILGKNKIIGVSCHSLKQALAAQSQGADYVGIGPIFPTLTKPGVKAVGPGLIRKCVGKLRIPFFAIGGINRDNLGLILGSLGKRIALTRAICDSKDIARSIRYFACRLKKINDSDRSSKK